MSDLELKIKRTTMAAEARGIKVNERRLRRRLAKLATKFGHKVSTEDAALAAQRAARAFIDADEQALSLRAHRLDVARPEARAMHLACNFLRGRQYRDIEAVTRWRGQDERGVMRNSETFHKQWVALWERVRYHVEKHAAEAKGSEERSRRLQAFAAWHDQAQVYALNYEAQVGAKEAARGRSIAAAEKRCQAYRKRKMQEDTIE